MEQWSGIQRAFAIKSFYKNNEGYVAAQRWFRVPSNLKRYDPVPSTKAIKIWINNFKETDLALKKKILNKKKLFVT